MYNFKEVYMKILLLMITIMFTGCKSSNDKIMYMYDVDDRHYDLN